MNFKLSNFLSLEWYWHLIISATIIGISLLLALVISYQADAEERSRMIINGRLVSINIPNEDLKTLSGTADDLKNPVYQKIKRSFDNIISVNSEIKFLSILGLKNNQVFFYINSQSPTNSVTSTVAIQPGDFYKESATAYADAFESIDEKVVGPFTNRFGNFMSVLVPLYVPESHQVLALLVLDIDANAWFNYLASRYLFVIIIGILLVVTHLSLVFFFKRYQKAMSNKNKYETK